MLPMEIRNLYNNTFYIAKGNCFAVFCENALYSDNEAKQQKSLGLLQL